MKAIYILVIIVLLSEVEGGKLMKKIFACKAKNKDVSSRKRRETTRAEKEVQDMYGNSHKVMDEETKSRETLAKAEENLKTHYFQGDMMLTHHQQTVMTNAFKFASQRSDIENRAMIKDVARLWPDGKVPYAFAADIDDEGKSVAKSAMDHWMEHTCVKFAPRTTEKDFVEFQFADACASRVGRLQGKQEILIGSPQAKCKVGNLIHELGHTLGFFHEHSRPDRDSYVRVAFDRVRPGFEINFKKLPADWIDSRDVAYDYGSIMHYPRTIFGKTPWDETVVPLDAAAQVGQRIKLSDPDILQAKKLYRCPDRTTVVKMAVDKKYFLFVFLFLNGSMSYDLNHKRQIDEMVEGNEMLLEGEDLAKAEENLNSDFFEGDILTTPEQMRKINKLLLHHHDTTDAADTDVSDTNSAERPDTRGLIRNLRRTWPSGMVYYEIGGDLDPRREQIIEEAMDHWRQRTCLKFARRTNQKDYVHFQSGAGCASFVGRIGGSQRLVFGKQCKLGNIIHEIGHAIGFFHEMARPDRDKFVKINWKYILPGRQRNFLKFTEATINSRGVDYDYRSIMHYSRLHFTKSRAGNLETIVPRIKGAPFIGQRIGLSVLDIKQAKLLYNCDGNVAGQGTIPMDDMGDSAMQ
ncbi:zinc metalloproteinase nas-10-like [Dendronephthya gigantea]|uniref:zinc metalloproteinase nas-10-like n=1 Tax=Dendronephthya gigantea TaxID=151771 RepID=UPI00106D935E|nr:zinc metalloproteinase nas-10-like [Dendronephthya gigantea]